MIAIRKYSQDFFLDFSTNKLKKFKLNLKTFDLIFKF